MGHDSGRKGSSTDFYNLNYYMCKLGALVCSKVLPCSGRRGRGKA